MGSLFSCFNKGYRPESSWSRLWGLGYMPPKGLARRRAFLPPVNAYKAYGDQKSRTLLFQIHSEMKNGNKRIKRSKDEEQDDPYFIWKWNKKHQVLSLALSVCIFFLSFYFFPLTYNRRKTNKQLIEYFGDPSCLETAGKYKIWKDKAKGSEHAGPRSRMLWWSLWTLNLTAGSVFQLCTLGLPGFTGQMVIETKSVAVPPLEMNCLGDLGCRGVGDIFAFWWQVTETQLKPAPAKMEGVLDLESGDSRGTNCFRWVWVFKQQHQDLMFSTSWLCCSCWF